MTEYCHAVLIHERVIVTHVDASCVVQCGAV